MCRNKRRSGRGLCASRFFSGDALLLLGAGFYLYKLRKVSEPPGQRTLTRVTFDDGLQIGATWSPDGRYIALQFGPRRKVRHLGAAGKRRRSYTDHQGTGAQLAAGLVAGWQIHRVSFRGR